MKLFQQLLVAPAALGLIASGANAAELNINGVSDYAFDADQVTSVTQFSDVYPTDWAYQALANLVETYGCVASYPNATFRGNRAMTRYEAAALLNACLDRITEVTDELRRLLKEFETELAILKGRVDGLEARVGELEATQFFTTTKLKGVTNWIFGAANFTDDQGSGLRGGVAILDDDGNERDVVTGSGTSFSSHHALNLETSFSGEDLLYTRLRSGNMGDTIHGGNGVFAQEYGFDSGNDVRVARLYYSFPVGDVTITGGPVIRQDDMLPVWPSAYPSDMTFDYFTYAGAPGAYPLTMGGGAGITYTNDNWTFSTSYLSSNANNSCSNAQTCVDDDGDLTGGGVMTDAAGGLSTTQIAYAEENWGVAAAATFASENIGGTLYQGNATLKAADSSGLNDSASYGLSAWWMPEESGWIPSVSTGFGVTLVEAEAADLGIDDDVEAELYSWYVGLEWDDAFTEGNSLGLAFGQPTWVGNVSGDEGDLGNIEDTPGYAWELFYKFQLTDNITVTPALTWLTKPFSNDRALDEVDAFSGIIKTTFKF